MISRRTIGALLLTLLLAGSLWAWSAGHRDECSAWLAGDLKAPATQVVESGTRLIVVPCSAWLPRQAGMIQALCLVMAAGVTVFCVSVWADWKKRSGRRW